MKILVTAQRYLGTHVRRFFNADDFSRRSNLNITMARDATLVADYDVVIHLAAYLDKDPGAAEVCFSTNADGTLNLIRNMRAGCVFIYASTKDVYGPTQVHMTRCRRVVRPIIVASRHWNGRS